MDIRNTRIGADPGDFRILKVRVYVNFRNPSSEMERLNFLRTALPQI